MYYGRHVGIMMILHLFFYSVVMSVTPFYIGNRSVYDTGTLTNTSVRESHSQASS